MPSRTSSRSSCATRGQWGIDAVCRHLDEDRVELIADFQSIYHLNILDVLTGRLDAGSVLELLPGLRTYPALLYRARWLSEHPADPKDESSKELSFYGWSQDSMLQLRLHNSLAAQAAGSDKKARRALVLDGSQAKRKPGLFAGTGLMKDGRLLCFSALRGDTALSMVTSGVVHSWSYGPDLVVKEFRRT